MQIPLSARAFAAVTLVVALGGCGLFKTNEDVAAVVNKRAVGTPVGDFFDRYGRAALRNPLGDGTIEYVWLSSVGFQKSGPEELAEHVCKLHLTADQRGRISSVEVLYDAPGFTGTSRCREIFAAA